MAKKNSTKKFDTPETNQEDQVTQAEAQLDQASNGGDESEGEAAPNTQFTAKPQFYLASQSDETQYQFTRFNMPKKAEKNPEGEITVIINGVEHPAWLTSSKGWAADDARIDYVWLELVDGSKGYITLDYGVDAATFNGHEFEIKAGKANRDNPKRVPRDPAKEDNRKAQFSATMAKKAAEPKAADQNEPAAEGDQPQQAA
jgi:hypothetical protein